VAAGLDLDGAKCYEPKDVEHVGVIPDPPEKGSVNDQRLLAALRASTDVGERACGFGFGRAPREMAHLLSAYSQDLRVAARYDTETGSMDFEEWVRDFGYLPAAVEDPDVVQSVDDPVDLFAQHGIREVRVLLNRVDVDVSDHVFPGTQRRYFEFFSNLLTSGSILSDFMYSLFSAGFGQVLLYLSYPAMFVVILTVFLFSLLSYSRRLRCGRRRGVACSIGYSLSAASGRDPGNAGERVRRGSLCRSRWSGFGCRR
jgi:hypothetical protein